MLKAVLFVFIVFCGLYGEEAHPYVKERVKIIGKVTCKREIISVIDYGNDTGEIEYSRRIGFCAPRIFDIDEKEDIYIWENPWLYKYKKNNQLLKKSIDPNNAIGDHTVDFKYYDKRVFIYEADKIKILDSDNFELLKEISLEFIENRCGIAGSPHFENHFLFIRNCTFSIKHAFSVEHIYDLKNNVFSEKINENTFISPITKCKSCDLTILNELEHFSNSRLRFLGQTDNYLCFRFFCSPDYNTGICENEIEQYYLMNKKNKKTWILSFDGDPMFTHLPTRPFVFINDTTFIYQSLIGNRDGEFKNGSQEKLVYSKMHLKFEH